MIYSERRVYVDLDGVLCDFDSHYRALTGIIMDWSDYNAGRTKVQPRVGKKGGPWWKPLLDHPTFYRDLPLMPGALDLWEMLLPYEPYILSAMCPHIPQSGRQKLEWCAEHLGLDHHRVIVVGDRMDKPRYCLPGDILLDDQPSNIENWNVEGGYGIRFVSVEQAIADLSKVLESDHA